MKIAVHLTFILGYLCTCNGFYNIKIKNQTLWHVIFDNINQTYLQVPEISLREQGIIKLINGS